jgi:hypothetical protein
MNWNDHSNLAGKHAFLSASKYHWLNYDEEKLQTTYSNHLAVQRGTELHEFADYMIQIGIKYGIKLKESNNTINMYVNDAIGFRMQTEQTLYYSENAYGTCDAICFRDGFLRIHDLKTGVTPANITQLYIYTALFCLEYKMQPKEIGCELRIYQDGNILVNNPTVDEIVPIMDKIIWADKIITRRQIEEGF